VEDFAHRAVSRAQRKFGAVSPMGLIPKDDYDGPPTPLSHKSSTMGSVAQRTAWRTPSGVALSAQSRKSTLFDDDAPGVSKISRDS
jgi:hypothetical protein